MIWDVVNVFTISFSDEGSGADYSVVSTTARISYQSSSPASIAFILRTDSVALEQDESFTLELVPSTTLPSGSNVFFQNVSTVTIIDSDSEYNIIHV